MYCSNQSSMATLLQQKSFMKNLTNGANNVVVVNGTGGSEENQDGTSLVTGGTVPGTSRMLLPHEGLTTGGLIHQQPLIHQQTGVNSASSFNSQFISHLQSNHHLSTQQLFGTAVASAVTTTAFQQSSQFSNAYVDVNAIFRSTATSSSINSSNSSSSFASPHHQLPHLVATSNATSSLVYVNGTHPSSASTTSTSGVVLKSEPNHLPSHHLHHHQQQQTATESQTANNNHNATTDPNRGSSTSGNGGRGNGTEEQKPATATTAAAAVPSPTDASLKDGTTTGTSDIKTEHQDDQDQEAEPEIDIVINNVVCSFSVRCHLNLRDIAQKGFNVEFRRENGMVTMKLRRPYTTASIWSSGKITCTGATSEDQAKVAARRYSRCLQKLGFNVRFRNFRIVNVLGTCSMPWGIMIVNFSEKYKRDASYEPELHPGVTYKLHSPKATLKIFSTGSITVTAASVAFVQAAIEHIFPLVYEFRKKRTPQEKLDMLKQPAFDPQELLIEEETECDIVEPSAKMVYEDDEEDPGELGCDEDPLNHDTKAIQQHRRNARRQCKSRYSNSRSNGGQRCRPAGKADNDPTEDAMYVSDDDEDMIDSDED